LRQRTQAAKFSKGAEAKKNPEGTEPTKILKKLQNSEGNNYKGNKSEGTAFCCSRAGKGAPIRPLATLRLPL
jgi:hypothetical protein